MLTQEGAMATVRGRFARLLRERIGERTQAAVAEEIGIDQASMSRYLRGTRPSVRNARRLAEWDVALADVLTDWLFWDIEEERT